MRSTLIVAAFCILAVSAIAQSTIPERISYQGRLTDDLGNPVDTTVEITFVIYSSAGGQNDLWKEIHPSVTVTDGLFDVLLGSITPLGTGVFNGNTRYLGLAVGVEPVAYPLSPIVSTAYAYRSGVASSADQAVSANFAQTSNSATTADSSLVSGFATYADTAWYVPGLTSSGWVDMGTRVVASSPNDSVAIGHLSPDYKLDVRDSKTAIYGRTTGSIYMSGVYGRAEYTGFGVTGTSSDGRGVYGASTTGFGGYFLGEKNYLSAMTGIGTENPDYPLTVNGAIGIQNSGSTQFHMHHTAGGLAFSETGVASYRLFLEDGGDVGIGTSNPTTDFHVAGDAKIDGMLEAGTILTSSIADETGLVTDEYWEWQPMTGSWSTIASRTINAPAPGYVVVLASAEIFLDQDASGGCGLEIGISDIPDSVGIYDDYRVRLPSSADMGSYYRANTIHQVFTVASPGAYTYYFMGKESSDNPVYVSRRTMTCLYIPTAYGGISKSPDGDPGDMILSSDAAPKTDDIDITAELSALKAELARLKQQLGVE